MRGTTVTSKFINNFGLNLMKTNQFIDLIKTIDLGILEEELLT